MDDLSETNRFSWITPLDAWFLFIKAQFSAFIGGICDYSIMIIATQYVGLFYGYSIIISGIVGAVINFSINRYWTFQRADAPGAAQLKKFIAVVIGSILLKSTGTWLLTEFLKLDYHISRICVDALVCFGFNYTLQRHWVFKSK